MEQSDRNDGAGHRRVNAMAILLVLAAVVLVIAAMFLGPAIWGASSS
jgi:hypothetical protein